MENLSLRLRTIASLVPLGARVCDVGTDHAYLPIFLKLTGITNNIIATDLNQKPLENAQKNIEKRGIDNISLRLCNGLCGVEKNEVDTIIIAGMGGEVITDIISSCKWAKSQDILFILQPTTSAEILREYLVENGFTIINETPISENGKLYSVMTVKFTDSTLRYPEHYYFTGEMPKNEEGILYIKKQLKRLNKCMKALKNIDTKQEEFEKYKLLCEQIENLLTEN